LCACVAVLAALAAACGPSAALECPDDGAALRVTLQAAAGAPPATATVLGFVTTPSCDDGAERLATTYAQTVRCDRRRGRMHCVLRWAAPGPVDQSDRRLGR
jgi:hypothetical protein